MTLTFGSLFAGIGGIDLGLERAGMECRWQVEIDPYATRVLEKHWPNVRRYSDVREAAGLSLVDVVAGGFPCTDISNAGARAGIGADRSGLWVEFARVVREVRPAYVIVENVPALLVRGAGTVLGDLATLGYDAEWDVIPTCAFGAPQTRERLFIVAYPQGEGWDRRWGSQQRSALLESMRCREEQRRTWAIESRPLGLAYGIPRRMERLRGFGNAVSPQVAEYIGRCIIAAEAAP